MAPRIRDDIARFFNERHQTVEILKWQYEAAVFGNYLVIFKSGNIEMQIIMDRGQLFYGWRIGEEANFTDNFLDPRASGMDKSFAVKTILLTLYESAALNDVKH